MPSYIRVKLRPKEEDRLLAGHPWVYANEVDNAPKTLSPGALAEVVTSKGEPVGRGVASPSSKILIRLLTRGFERDLDESFIAGRVGSALRMRRGFGEKNGTDGVRLIFGEADGLPGVVADAFGETVVLSCHSAGMKPFLPVIAAALRDGGFPRVYEKSLGEARQKEGLAEFQGWLTDPGDTRVGFAEGKARFRFEAGSGQKTGFYLDFREARRRMGEWSAGKTLLDVFAYTGASSIQAALGGAGEVLGLESSPAALEAAEENARANGVDQRVRFQREDSFKALKALKKEGRTFDGVILDPPPLAKSVHDLPAGRTAFKSLMGRALDLLAPGGRLLAATCSHHFSWTLLEDVAREAVEESGRTFRLLERLSQPPDHPVVLSIPETEYLRVLILEETGG